MPVAIWRQPVSQFADITAGKTRGDLLDRERYPYLAVRGARVGPASASEHPATVPSPGVGSRPMRPLKLATLAVPLLLLAAGCSSAPHPPAACGIAIDAAHYAGGKNGTQDASNDLRAASALRHASWPTAALRGDADSLAAAFTSYSQTGTPGFELMSKGISGGISRLLGACKKAG